MFSAETTYVVMLVELALITFVQLLTVVAAGMLVFGAAWFYDLVGHSMSWFTHVWLTAGLYGVPLWVGLLLGPVVYLQIYRRMLRRSLHQHKEFDAIMTLIRRSYHVQLFIHAHALLNVVALVVLTAMGIRSAYLVVFGLVFYGASTLVNYVLRFHVCGMLFHQLYSNGILMRNHAPQTRAGCMCILPAKLCRFC